MVAIPKFMLLSGDFQLPIGQVWLCAILLAGFKQSLREMAGGTDPDIGDWMEHPMLREFFATAARDPFSLDTNWIWPSSLLPPSPRQPRRHHFVFAFPSWGLVGNVTEIFCSQLCPLTCAGISKSMSRMLNGPRFSLLRRTWAAHIWPN